MQLWPAKENAFAASRVAASSRSASAATITGVALPQLEVHALARSALAELPADARRAGEGDERDALVSDQEVADLCRRSAHDIEPAGRQACVRLELGQEKRRERRLRRGLQHHGAACR